MDDGLTVFCPFSRDWCVGPFFEALGASDVPIERATLIAYVDSADPALEALVRRQAGRLPFRSVHTFLSGLIEPVDGAGPVRRRRRHSLMRQLSQGLVTGDRELLLLEDDTLMPQNAHVRLRAALDRCEWVVGAEVGRWGSCRPPGVWRIVTDAGRPVAKEAMLPGADPVERIDASGLYCVLTRTGIYRELDFAAWADPIGLDTHVTWRLTQAGRRLMVDWGVSCVHLTEKGPLTMAEAERYTRPLKVGEGAPNQFVTAAAELETVRRLTQRRRHGIPHTS